MKRTAAPNFITSPVTVIANHDPYAVALYNEHGLFAVARTWKDANAVLEAAARDVPTDAPVKIRAEAFFPRGGAIVFPWSLSRAHQLGCEVAGGAWEVGMRSGGIAWG